MTKNNDQRPKTEFIIQSMRFMDNAGRVIEKREAVHGELPSGWPVFIGHSVVVIQDDRGQPIAHQPVQFPLSVDTIEEAFRDFDTAGEKASAEVLNQMKEHQRDQASQILVPGMSHGKRS